MVDKVTKMAAELIFSVDDHISLTHSGGKPYECDPCKYSSALTQALKRHKLTLGGERHCHSEESQFFSDSKSFKRG